MSHPSCPLCHESAQICVLESAMPRRYLSCDSCGLAFMHPADYLSAADEKAYYATHENSIEDEGYVRFLNILLEPLLSCIAGKQDLHALDYGCGPGPTLSVLLEKAGVNCDNYDPFFFPQAVTPPYDVITATECFEHFHRPEEELSKLTSWLDEEGILALMTSRWDTPEKFMHWHYNRDPTHVIFMHDKTIKFIEEKFGLTCIYRDKKRVTIFKKIGIN
ncbi:MAG: class I SAM-dependent methyltransferase [Thalassolituus sp.]